MRLLVVGFYAIPKIIWRFFNWILPYRKNKNAIPFRLRFYKLQKAVIEVNRMLNTNMHIIDFDKSEEIEGNRVIVGNHTSMYDILMVLAAAKKPTRIVAKIQIRKYPVLPVILDMLDCLYMDRGNSRQELQTVLTMIDTLKNEDYDWAIFPEGTRNKGDKLKILPFHAGTFKVPTKAKSSILTVSIYSSYKALKLFKYNFKRANTYIKYSGAITPNEYVNLTTAEVAAKAEDLVQKGIYELVEFEKTNVLNP